MVIERRFVNSSIHIDTTIIYSTYPAILWLVPPKCGVVIKMESREKKEMKKKITDTRKENFNSGKGAKATTLVFTVLYEHSSLF